VAKPRARRVGLREAARRAHGQFRAHARLTAAVLSAVVPERRFGAHAGGRRAVNMDALPDESGASDSNRRLNCGLPLSAATR
jgi:hypothetical protein